MLCILQQSLQKSHFCLTEANFGLSPARNHVFFGLFVREAFCNSPFKKAIFASQRQISG